jgi:hypothetical protein
MAIGAGTVTLADYALMSNQPLVQAVTMSLIDYGNVLQDVQMITKPSLTINGRRFEGNLPTVTWSQLNAEGTTVKGTPTAYQEQVYILRNYIDVDKFLLLDQNQIVDPRATEAQIYLKAYTYDVNYKFFKNDHITGDANAPVGIRYRIDNGGVFGVRPENKIDAGGLDITQATLGTTPVNGNKLLEFLDQLLWSVDSPDGEGVVLYMCDVMKRRFNYAMRALGTAGGLATTQDQFNRTISMYKGAVIRDPGYKADQATRILTTTETSAGLDGASTMTSIYAVNHGLDHFFGWQMAEFNVQDLGLINNGVIYRTLIDWAAGLVNTSTRSIGRLYDLKIQ